MAMAGELADGFMLSYLHKDLIGGHVEAITAAAEANGRPRPRLSYMTALVTDDDSFEATRRGLTFRLVDSPAEVRSRIGMSDDDVAQMRTAIADGGLDAAAEHVRPEWVGQFAIVGSTDDCRVELHRAYGAKPPRRVSGVDRQLGHRLSRSGFGPIHRWLTPDPADSGAFQVIGLSVSEPSDLRHSGLTYHFL